MKKLLWNTTCLSCKHYRTWENIMLGYEVHECWHPDSWDDENDQPCILDSSFVLAQGGCFGYEKSDQ